jgi:hypothetical protein
VFYLQDTTVACFRLIEEIGGEADQPSFWYADIVKEGTGREMGERTNENWLAETRPILEALWYTKYYFGGRKDVLPVEPEGCLSFLILLGEPRSIVFRSARNSDILKKKDNREAY